MIDTQIIDLYKNLAAQRKNYMDKAERAILAKVTLDDAKRAARLEGKITGKNETEREDAAASLLSAELASLRAAEADERYARYLLDEALAGVEMAKLIVRAESITMAQPTYQL